MKIRIAIAIAPAVLLTASWLFSYGTGAFPGTVGTAGTVPLNVTRQVPGCAGTALCHRTFPGGNQLRVFLAPTAFSLTPGQQLSVTSSATGGTPHPANWGGFVAETTAGTFAAGSNSQVSTNGRFVTHTAATNSNNRRWTYGLTAPVAPGLFELYTVVNTVDGDGMAGGQDQWGFFGINAGASVNVPVRLFVNAANVVPFGTGCVGSFGNTPVLGTAQSPTVGNAGFNIELHGAMTSAPTSLLIGANPGWTPIDLTLLGANGCFLNVDPLLRLDIATSAGDPLRGEGSATYPIPLPNNPAWIGLQIQAQAVIVDTSSGRPLPITTTNALRITFQ